MTDYRYKWVRSEYRSVPDRENVKRHINAGWEKVPDDEAPTHLSPPKDRWGSNMLDPANGTEQGGLVLYRLTADKAAERDAYYREMTEALSVTVTNNVFNCSDDPRNGIIAKLEDFYNPMRLVEYNQPFGRPRDTQLAAANDLLKQIDLPPWELKQLRRELLKHMAKRSGIGWFQVASHAGPVWWIPGRSEAAMRELRLAWRMPKGFVEHWIQLRDDVIASMITPPPTQ